MASYYILRARPSVEAEDVDGYMEIEDWHDVPGFEGWGIGERATQRPTEPVELPAVPHDGFTGGPDEFQDASVPLMSRRMKEALDAAGIDNIEYHPITLRNTETGETYAYFAFNIVGCVSAIDRRRSNIASPDSDWIGDTRIHDLALDESRIAESGLRIFRLRERFSVIVVHETVKEAIERNGITSVAFVRPQDFMAL